MRLSFFCALIFIGFTVEAQVPEGFSKMRNIPAFKAGIDKMAAETNTIQTGFTQEKHVDILAKNLISEGNMTFRKPQSLRWAYTKPYDYVIVLDGKQVVVSDDGKVNAFDMSSSEVFKEINDIIVNSVQGNIIDENRFNITYLENEKQYCVTLVPKEARLREHLNEITVFFDRQLYLVDQVRMNEPGGDYTQISFQNRKLNEPVRDEVFQLR